MRYEAPSSAKEAAKLLAGAKEEVHSLINEAKGVAQAEREQLLAKTREEQSRILERAKREIDAERERAVGQLRQDAVELSLAAAAKLIQERLDSDADRKIVEEYIGSLGSDVK